MILDLPLAYFIFTSHDLNLGDVVIKTLLMLAGINAIKRIFKLKDHYPKLNQYVGYIWVIFGILILLAGFLKSPYDDRFFYYTLFGAFLLILKKINNNRLTKAALTASLPLFFVSLVSNLVEIALPKTFKGFQDSLDNLQNFGILWLIGFGFYALRNSNKETKALELEAEKRRQLEAQKNTLEYQVAERTAEITQQKNELVRTLKDLKSTQNQLVHAEKMASLGELTAGIAHEIQNPLNFVNNFSELNVDLIAEIKEEMAKKPDNRDEPLLLELLDNLTKNQEKINHHGKRADGIVKSMLQHSRLNTGQKEPININALADEYLRLSYHGLRAKDKSFNAQYSSELDPKLPLVNGIAQDIGRVILNIINNAFYAVNERKIKGNDPSYSPTVTIQTEHFGKNAIIRIKDNGTGIPADNMEKVFQPFFTSKPTGQGTGLGLSLSYDIIKNGHNGSIDVISKENEGTEFMITLPIK